MDVDHELPQPEYTVLKQRVDLDVEFAHRSLKGTTEITIQPLTFSLRQIRLHARQATIKHVNASGLNATWTYDDPYTKLRMREGSGVQQWQMLKERIRSSLKPNPEPELVVNLPKNLRIQELQLEAGNKLPSYNGAPPSLQKQESDAMAVAEAQENGVVQATRQFAPVKILVEFEVEGFRDGLHWVGFEENDRRYPYCYTRAQEWAGNTSSIFPCVDDANSRYTWDISIKCARTLGDALKKPEAQRRLIGGEDDTEMTGEDDNAQGATKAFNANDYLLGLEQEDAGLDLAIVCSGDLVDDVVDTEDEAKHTVSFSQLAPVAARHITFAIGPFEHVDLSAYREAEEEERLGQSAVKVDGYCLPGRAEELGNTCFPLTMAIDHLGVNFGAYPFSTYQALFVDDLVQDSAAAAGMGIFANRLLFPADIIEPLDRNTHTLIRALANQWFGVSIIPNSPDDEWVVAGCGAYMTEIFLKKIMGNNDFRWRQKLASEKIYELDVDRPSLAAHGSLLHLDPFIREFMDLKAKMVLFILDRRILKSNATAGVLRIISKLLLNAKNGTLANGELSTSDFKRMCEKLGHNKLEPFFRQWVVGAGAPIFHVTQRFNKKKLVVEMTIQQRQLERVTKPAFTPSNYMREIKEHVGEVWAPEVQAVFTGPMTIRIHEADGTPYEHIVEIKEAVTKLEIPYNTKYKRLKRSRRQKERAAAASGNNDPNAAGGDEGALLYCLGDILDTDEEKTDWRLADWTTEDEDKMAQESYEWIRMDADFEWIGKIHLDMPLYMHVSQLQQDRDLVAQYESVKIVISSNPHAMSFSILLRTLVDRRYFHGIREMAAEGLAKLAVKEFTDKGVYLLMKTYQKFFCFEDSMMPKPNDFDDRVQFLLQCAIPKAMALIRNEEGQVPMEVRRFFVDKLKFNDNSANAFSDAHYVATLMGCLSDALIASHAKLEKKKPEVEERTYEFSFGAVEDDAPGEDADAFMADAEDDDANSEDKRFEEEAVEEIERYRRIDEYISTYQNIYSTTAIQCLQDLSMRGIVKSKIAEILRYTASPNADNVRLKAFSCLSATGQARKPRILKYILHSLADDASPWFRDQLLAIFSEALGHIAIFDPEPEEQPRIQQPAIDNGELQLDEAPSTADRAQQLAMAANRARLTPEAALVAQRETLQMEELFKSALWHAITADTTSLNETAAVLDIAALIFEPENAVPVILPLPRGFKARNMGKGKINFYRSGPYLTKPSKELELEDWQSLQQHGLSYIGPLSRQVKETIRLQSQIEDAKRLQASQAQAPPSAVQTSQMLPPAATAFNTPNSANTAGSEGRPGIKLNFSKRKPTDDGREGSPKISKPNTPISATRPDTSKASMSPAPSGQFQPKIKKEAGTPSLLAQPKQRRNSTPSAKGKLTTSTISKRSSSRVILRIPSAAGTKRLSAILASTPNPKSPNAAANNTATAPAAKKRKVSHAPSTGAGISPTSTSAGMSPQTATRNTPLLPQGQNSSFFPAMSPPAAPSGAGNLGNAGAFRSYGSISQSPMETSPAENAVQNGNWGGFRSYEASAGSAAVAPAEGVADRAGSVSVKAEEGVEGGVGGARGLDGQTEPPPKKTLKLKLKFGKKHAREAMRAGPPASEGGG